MIPVDGSIVENTMNNDVTVSNDAMVNNHSMFTCVLKLHKWLSFDCDKTLDPFTTNCYYDPHGEFQLLISSMYTGTSKYQIQYSHRVIT